MYDSATNADRSPGLEGVMVILDAGMIESLVF